MAISDALDLVSKTGDLPVPLNIRNAPTSLMKELGYGNDYKYAHDYDGNFTQEEFLPKEIREKILYDPQENPRELEIKKRLAFLWKNKYNY
jgi:putative ATPase